MTSSSPLRARRATFSAVLMLSGTFAYGADRTWTNASGGTFTTAANWAGSLVAGAADRAIFNATASNALYGVNFAGNVTNDRLSVRDNVLFSLGGSTYALTGSSPMVIGEGGTDAGSLTIGNGTISTATGLSSIIGGAAGSSGMLTVQSTATLSMGASLFVGLLANGTLNVSGRYTGTSLVVGGSSSASGVVNVTGGIADVSLTGTAAIGDFADGTLLFSGASFSAPTMNIGDQPGGNGTFVQTGAAGITTVTTTRVAQFNNTGVLQLTAGTYNSSNTFVGGSLNDVAGNGTVFIGGGVSAARYNNTGVMRVGTSGSSVGGNGTLIVTGSNAQLTTGSLAVGTASSNGYVRVQHAGAIINSGVVNIGGNSRGTLEILSGGVVNATTVTIGEAINSIGVLQMNGAGSALNAGTSLFRVGAFAGSTGLVDITGGAVLTSGTGSIGVGSGAAGTVNVSGTGSGWVASSSIGVGSISSNGYLRVGPGATVSAGSLSTFSINALGTVEIDGGTLRAGNLTKAATGILDFASGTLQLTSGTLSIAAGGPLGDQLQLNPGQNLLGTTINISGIAAMQGGRLSAATIGVQPGGQLLLQNPSSVVAGLVANQGKVLGSGAVAGTLSNSAAGEVRAGLGERIAFTGTATSFNGGQINLLGGEVEFGGTFTNQLAGRVNGRGLLRASVISNFGTMTFSAGISDVFGDLTNIANAKTIITGAGNATFYGNVTNAVPTSEFRVSPGSIASFLGNVTGLSQFTGSGTTIFEGPASFGRINKSGATRVGPFGSLSAEHIRDEALFIEGATSILPNGTNAGASRVNKLDIDSGGRFDLSNNGLIIDYTGGSPFATIRGYIIAGRNGGAWNGDGINSTTAASNPVAALALAEASEIGSPAVFFGQSIDSTAVLARYTLLGDADLSGGVNLDDFTALAAGFGQPGSRWSRGDFNYDGVTNLDDFTALAANFGQTPPADAPRAAVPEPAGAILGLLAVAASMLPARRRR